MHEFFVVGSPLVPLSDEDGVSRLIDFLLVVGSESVLSARAHYLQALLSHGVQYRLQYGHNPWTGTVVKLILPDDAAIIHAKMIAGDWPMPD